MAESTYNKWERIAIIILLLLISTIYLIRLPHHRPIGDEGVIASWAYWHNETGEVRSDLHIGITETSGGKTYIYHKLFTLASSGIIHIFGVNIHLLRSISLLAFIILITFIYHYCKNKFHDKRIFLITVTLLMFQVSIFDLAWIARTDMVLIALGFGSFYYLEKALTSNKLYPYIVAGSLAGLSVFAHLNGLIIIFAGGILLLTKKKVMPILAFGFSSFLFTLLFFFDINSWEEIGNLFFSVKNSPDLQSANYQWTGFFSRILNEHLRFLHSESETTLTTLFLTALIFNFKNLRTKHRNLLIYMLSLMVGLGAISRSSSFVYYAAIYYPHMIFIIAVSFKDIYHSAAWKKYILLFFTISFIFFSLWGINNISKKNVDITAINKKIGTELNYGSKVITNAQFVFNEINNFKIQGFLSYRFHLHIQSDKPVYIQKDFLEFCEKYENEYIIFNFKLKKDDIVKMFDFEKLQINDTIGNYTVMKNNAEYAILKHNGSKIFD